MRTADTAFMMRNVQYKKGKLGFIIPDFGDSGFVDQETAVSLESVEAWRNALPLNDLNASIKSCHQMLKQLQAFELPADQRLEIMGVIKPVIRILCDSLLNYYKQSLLTPKQSLIELYRIILTLNIEQYNVYKLILEDLHATQDPNHRFMEGIYWALRQSCKIIFYSFQAYLPAPTHIWKETHQLFLLANRSSRGSAVDNNAHSNTIQDKQKNWQAWFKKISTAYKHILLYSLVNPGRYHPQDALQLYLALEHWAPFVNFLKRNDHHHLFKVELDKDMPPHYVMLDQNDSQHRLYINLELVLYRVDDLIAYQDQPQSFKHPEFQADEVALSSTILQIIMHIWQNESHRKFPRKRMSGMINATLGFKNIYEALTELNYPTERGSSLRGFTQTDVLCENNVGILDDIEEINLDAIPLPKSLSKNKLNLSLMNDFQIVDKSVSGYCLKFQSKLFDKIEAGDILCLLENVDPPETKLAMVRWTQISSSDETLMGVEIISEKILPTQALRDGAEDPAESGILIMSLHAVPVPLLVLPHNRKSLSNIKAQDKLVINAGFETYHCRAHKRTSLSLNFDLFELDFLDKPFALPSLSNEGFNKKQA